MPERRFSTMVGSNNLSPLFIVVSPEAVTALSEKKRPPVRVTLNGGYTYRPTIAVPGGRYYLPVRSEIREACGLTPDMSVEVTVALDEEPRQVEVPGDLAAAFVGDQEAQDAFDRPSFTRRREYVDWVAGAKREMLRNGAKTPG